MTVTRFLRLGYNASVVYAEVQRGEFWMIPNPTPDGKSYAPERAAAAIRAAGRINLSHWLRVAEAELLRMPPSKGIVK